MSSAIVTVHVITSDLKHFMSSVALSLTDNEVERMLIVSAALTVCVCVFVCVC